MHISWVLSYCAKNNDIKNDQIDLWPLSWERVTCPGRGQSDGEGVTSGRHDSGPVVIERKDSDRCLPLCDVKSVAQVTAHPGVTSVADWALKIKYYSYLICLALSVS